VSLCFRLVALMKRSWLFSCKTSPRCLHKKVRGPCGDFADIKTRASICSFNGAGIALNRPVVRAVINMLYVQRPIKSDDECGGREQGANLTTAHPRPNIRGDVEGLRAIAVLAVMTFHFGSPWLTGGFVGVDIFFVISGYLITGILVSELENSGRIDLPRFYGRRARRLLPALLLVTVVTLVFGAVILSPPEQISAARAALASSLYVSNFWFLSQWFDYFAPENAHNPFLHTWSLSVEEQFYLFWPALLLLAGRSKPNSRTLAITIIITTAISFVICLWLTNARQAWAFYASPTRAWEFGLGALASLTPVTCWARSSKAAPVIGWVGLALVLLSFVVINEDIPFPGLVALLPSAATACVLASGASGKLVGPVLLLRAAPFQWFGRLSYSIYLWHWPIIVYASIADPSLSAWGRLGCIALTLACAAASYHVLERPIRLNVWLAERAIRSLGMGLSFSMIGAIAAGATGVLVDWLVASSLAQRTISNVTLRLPAAGSRGCLVEFTHSRPVTCFFGPDTAPKTIVLFGDSHADEWSTPLAFLAGDEGWRVVTYLKASCSVADIPVYNIRLHRLSPECASWRSQALAEIVKLRPVAVVIYEFSSYYIRGPITDLGARAVDLTTWAAGLERSLRTLTAAGIRVIVVRDNPTPGRNMRECLSYAAWHKLPESRCATPRLVALSDAVTVAEHKVANAIPGVRFVDFTSEFCDQTICPAVRGGLIVYRDGHHLTTSYAMGLAEPLRAALSPVINGETNGRANH
jgi:peptidoglycan/LPS O-acetylase OafA/YrhL